MHDVSLVFFQVFVILTAAWAFGWLCERSHQPRVLGEMTAGILLGPTVLGAISPSALHTLFPAPSLPIISGLSQIGLVLYLFFVGLELDTPTLIANRRTAAFVSWSGIVVPFVLGILMAWRIHPIFEPASVPVLNFALFVGVAMSITAFPVLVRILHEQHLIRTRVGVLAVASAAVDDVTSWCMLAVVIALSRSASGLSALPRTVLPLVLYLAIMFLGVRRVLLWLENRGWLPTSTAYLLAFASAGITELIGVHALFGAFVAGLVFPRSERGNLEAQLLPLSSVLLPLFFAFSGLRTLIPLRGGWVIWGYGVLILLVAIAGKFGACAIAARITGLSWRESAALGTLLNTRGLVELVILNIGYDMGIISQSLFSLLVFMALLTTFMTAPLLRVVYARQEVEDKVTEIPA